MRRVGHEDLVALGLAARAVVGADHEDPGELALGAGRGMERHGVHAADLDQRLLELPQQLQRPLGGGVGGQRVQRAKPGIRAAHSSILGLYFIVHEPSG